MNCAFYIELLEYFFRRKTRDCYNARRTWGLHYSGILLKDIISPDRVNYRDNLSYFNILLDNNIRKWICRLYLNSTNKSIQFNDDDKTIIALQDISDLIFHKEKIVQTAERFI